MDVTKCLVSARLGLVQYRAWALFCSGTWLFVIKSNIVDTKLSTTSLSKDLNRYKVHQKQLIEPVFKLRWPIAVIRRSRH